MHLSLPQAITSLNGIATGLRNGSPVKRAMPWNGQGAGGFDSNGRTNRSESLSLGGGSVTNSGLISEITSRHPFPSPTPVDVLVSP